LSNNEKRTTVFRYTAVRGGGVEIVIFSTTSSLRKKKRKEASSTAKGGQGKKKTAALGGGRRESFPKSCFGGEKRGHGLQSPLLEIRKRLGKLSNCL